MTRVLMTGMCTSSDRLIVSSDKFEFERKLYSSRVRLKSDVLREFKVARNLGNYLITEGASLALDDCIVNYIPFWSIVDRIGEPFEDIFGQFDACVFVTANILHVEFSLQDEISFFKKWSKPLIFMSVGVQKVADLESARSENTIALIEVFKRENVVVFTRGPLTKKVLSQLGVSNAIDACCPSAFAFPEMIVKSIRATKYIMNEGICNCWINGYLGASQSTVNDIRQISKYANFVSYVYQDEPLLFGTLDEFDDCDLVYSDTENLFLSNPTAIAGLSDIEYSGLAFFSPETWRARAVGTDLSVGRRFHGNLAVMQAGKPAVFVAHDDRVTDMVSGLGLPYLTPEEWAIPESRVEVLSNFFMKYDVSRAEDSYLKKFEIFTSTLREIGLRR